MQVLSKIHSNTTRKPSLVSVLLITYNHVSYIRQAIDGILMQEGPFEIELIVGDDCSTDGTSAIVDEYIASYPNIIRLLSRDKNLGASHNLDRCLSAGHGQYLATIEGDDYWTDPHKLARQVEFMDNNPDYSLCFHNALVVYEDGSGKASHPMTADLKREYTLDDITRDWNIASASLLYRNGLLPKLPEWAFEGTATDLPVISILANQGRVACLPEIMSVYRINNSGVTRTGKGDAFMLGIVRMHKNVDKYLGLRYHYNFTLKLMEDYNILTGIMANEKHYSKAIKYFLKYMFINLYVKKIVKIKDVKTLISLLIPVLR
ncbi:hypothetical protein CDA63_19070 [Hymenobacter amundsenii]|uniref:Glycosyltransferase 2-like domain-containing protein n=1 Tax=Hymenobacter amundsenii TaxID=2006685 RepID=A0A246FG51_9BACT|nr:glycosyltransferase [Hymenobacter amundsenii]OWP61517.1 hypothetical protein CDA63_19070 [Hymenobacter amundsenii]